MIHPIPPGTRDVLPDEMRELRALSGSLHATFDRAGFGEVWTPALEYEEVLRRGDERAAGAGFRLFDDRGHVLALRSDPTIPIARLVANRYAGEPGPLRLCYFAHAYRAVERGSGQAREFLQGGIELIGVGGAEGDAEVIALIVEALSEAGLRRHRIGLGDGMLYRAMLADAAVSEEDAQPLLEAVGVEAEQRERILAELVTGDFVGVERELETLQLDDAQRELLLRVPRMRGGPDILQSITGALEQAGTGMRDVLELLAPSVAERIIFDFGLVRSLGYYTGAVFQVYDPAHGVPIGSGGRYDELLGKFGRSLPAVGFALNVERLHIALTGEERGLA